MSKGNGGNNRRRKQMNHEFRLVSDDMLEAEQSSGEQGGFSGELTGDKSESSAVVTDDRQINKSETSEDNGAKGNATLADGERGNKKEKNKKRQMANESLRVQESEWILAQARERHKLEEEAWEHIQEEQQLLNERYRSIEAELNKTKEISRYHENFRNDLEEQMLALHGLSQDKLQGMKEYKNARYQGMAVAIFICSIAIAVICGWQYGITSQLTLFMGICVATEGALLSQEGRRGRAIDWMCRVLYMLPLPAMAGMYTCSKLWPEHLELAMSAAAITAMVIVIIGTVSYFLRNPYRLERKRVREARSDLKELEQLAHKAVKKNIKSRKRQERLEEKQTRRAAAKQERKTRKEAAKVKRDESRQRRSTSRKQYVEEFKTKLAKRSEERKLAKAEQASRKQARAEAKAQEKLARVVAQATAATETREQIKPDMEQNKSAETEAEAAAFQEENRSEADAEVIPISQKEA